MSINKLLTEIRAFCKKNADERIVKKYSKFFIEDYDPYGVDPKLMVPQRELWLNKYKDELGFEGLLKLSDLLVKSGKYEEAFTAIFFAKSFSDQFSPKTLERFGKWLESDIKNWVHTDGLSGDVLSEFFMKNIVSFDALSEWRKSKSRWKRRAVPVTMIKILKTEMPIKSLLDFIEPLMLDEEKVVHQGLGWFLRETWKLYPKPTEKFLLEWKDRCARLTIQYATEKMSAKKKLRFRKSK
jgi:3-methyladenine DNA glycosylase AlkD